MPRGGGVLSLIYIPNMNHSITTDRGESHPDNDSDHNNSHPAGIQHSAWHVSTTGLEPKLMASSSENVTAVHSMPSNEMSDPSSIRLSSIRQINTATSGASYPSEYASSNVTNLTYMREMAGTGNVQLDTMLLASGMRSNGSVPTSRPTSPTKMKSAASLGSVSGQKRTASGDIKPPSNAVASHSPGANGSGEHRSSTVGPASPGSRIAELSVHLRARLSYAAAKVEKSWQSRDSQGRLPVRFSQSASPIPSASTIDGPKQTMDSSWVEVAKGKRSLNNGSPDGTTLSAPDSSTSYDPTRMTAVGIPGAASSLTSSQSTPRASQTSPSKLLQAPKLAPPVDIIVNSQHGRRRRPNPNDMLTSSNPIPYPRHRRHHSQQEFGMAKPSPSSQMALIPGTPPLRPSLSAESTSHRAFAKPRTHSQSAIMEQDAIETLLFMSSPEHSGYHSSPKQKPSANIPTSVDSSSMSIRASLAGSRSQSSQSRESQNGQKAAAVVGGVKCSSVSVFPNQTIGLEAQAGDEIDRILDQMEDSDSEDERNYASYLGSLARDYLRGSRCGGTGQPGFRS